MAVLVRKRARKPGGAPSWVVTFADLATLLLTFFILLLSFAEMDLEKYRAMANSMAVALGSSNVLGEDIGGSPITLVESDTVSLPEVTPQPAEEPEFIDERSADSAPTAVPAGVVDLASRLITELEPEVAGEALSVNYDTEKVIIRFAEDATFRSGEAAIKADMIPIIERVVEVLASCSGEVLVAGYTDDRPVVSGRYRSNWDLSAARAVSVVHELVMNRQLAAERVTAAGRAETNPLVPNDSPENRARNRRVEITVRDPQCQPGTGPTPERLEILP
ncbi:MAG: flagellar motor protein MotB [Marinobacter sp.]|uniref:flagellar motor protein MotB n=1 Tax=Marinobacter sp. TaxID=50741 RepID=UPI00299E5EEE|nr:flagellar motor protein MotB [Marinobacter sp.]MDX1634134.1 flagellar motor protein MotB [Marinobacter sp.]